MRLQIILPFASVHQLDRIPVLIIRGFVEPFALRSTIPVHSQYLLLALRATLFT